MNIISLEGDYYEIGYRFGKLLKNKLKNLHQKFEKHYVPYVEKDIEDNLKAVEKYFPQFLKELNGPLTDEERSVKWITVRGLDSSGLLEAIRQPFLFRKVWINRTFPFVHIGIIPNDSVVDAASVPLKHAQNLTVVSANHMNLLKWISKDSGKAVRDIVKPIILER